MDIKLSDHFTYQKLLRFSAPSVFMIIFISIYSVIDGVFVSNFAGEIPFAAVNIVWPFLQIIGAVGFMIGAGGSALVAKTLGEGKKEHANRIFSMLIYTTIILGLIGTILGFIFIKPIIVYYDIKGELLNECMTYSYILLPAIGAFMLQFIFQSFLVVAEKPKLGLIVTTLAGCANIGLDVLFIAVFKWGIAGAAWATAISQIIGTGIPLLYFINSKTSPIKLCKTKFYQKEFIKSCTNGASEFMTNISMSVVCMLYNYQMFHLAAEKGIIAYGIVSYVTFIFLAVFLGYGIGTNPIVSYHYGAKNDKELKNLFQKNMQLIGCFAIILTLCAEISAEYLAKIFIGYDKELLEMTAGGFRIYAISFLFAGFNIYASSFFTALNNGLISATISFLRTFVFECACVVILPIFWGIIGIWTAIIVAEIAALAISVTFLLKYKTYYRY